MDRGRNQSYTERMHRDAKEVLVGLASLLVFGVALVVWPPFSVIYTMPFNPYSIKSQASFKNAGWLMAAKKNAGVNVGGFLDQIAV